MGVRIVLADNERIGFALRRFKKQLERDGVTWEMRRRSSFVKLTEVRRAKEFQKKFKTRKASLVAKMAAQQPCSSPASKLVAAFWRRTGKP